MTLNEVCIPDVLQAETVRFVQIYGDAISKRLLWEGLIEDLRVLRRVQPRLGAGAARLGATAADVLICPTS